MSKKRSKIIILCVEGDSEKEFYQLLIEFYKSYPKCKKTPIKIFNMKGITRFEQKAVKKIEKEVLSKYFAENISVFCCFDTDSFEFNRKPPTNWSKIEIKLNNLGINNFYKIKAIRMIEDWFLKDIDGLCKYLKIKRPKKLKGKDALEKIKNLFRKGNKIYQKGYNIDKFIKYLDIKKIRNSVKTELKILEKELNINN